MLFINTRCKIFIDILPHLSLEHTFHCICHYRQWHIKHKVGHSITGRGGETQQSRPRAVKHPIIARTILGK